jgi:hypothetical protein
MARAAAAVLLFGMATGPLEGAAARPVLPVTPKDHQNLALADLASMPSTGQGGTEASPDRLFQLYLSEYPLLNLPPGEARDKALADFEIALTLAVNLVSRSPDPVRPVRIAPALWRVDTREPGWKRARREKLAAIDPYFHQKVEQVSGEVEYETQVWPGGVDPADGRYYPPGRYRIPVSKKRKGALLDAAGPWLLSPEEAKGLLEGKIAPEQTNPGKLALLSGSQVPIIRADWFLVQVARQLNLANKETGAGYYDFLEIKDRAAYFALIGFDKALADGFNDITRAILDKSGVAQNNRQVERSKAAGGALWFTLDTDDPTGEGNALNFIRRGDFKHKAEEHYAPLPNGLPATGAFNADGTRQATVPDFVGSDKSDFNIGRDPRIHPNKSCASCHYRKVLQNIDDWTRRTFQVPNLLNFPDYQDQLNARRQYFSDLQEKLTDDRFPYQRAYIRICGCPLPKREDVPREAGRLLALWLTAYNDYVEYGVTLEDGAREHGCKEADLTRALELVRKERKNLTPALASWLAPKPGRIPRVTFEELFGLVQTHLRGLTP